MTRDRVLEAFALAGCDAAAASLRARFVHEAAERLSQASGRAAAWAAFVPGRIEIFGKHTDYAGGRSLVAAVPRGFAMAAHDRADGRVRAFDLVRHSSVEIDPQAPAPPLEGWSNYVAVVARRLAMNFPGAALGLDLAMQSDLPRAAGLSSSSALVVGIATALIARARLADRPEWRAAIQTTEDLAGYLGAVESGQTFRSLPGTAGVGTQGGSEDHTAILFCREETVSAFAYAPVRHVASAAMPTAWQFVVINSGVRADKAGSARERYNRAARTAGALLDLWNQVTGQSQPTVADLVRAEPGLLSELPHLVRAAGPTGFTDLELTRRLAHFVAEDARVPLAVDAFLRADAATLEELARASQEEADTLLGNQVHETRELASLAVPQGARAATSFGAGFGGSVWALVEGTASDAEAFAARWLAAYRRSCPYQPNAAAFVTRPGAGIVSLDLTAA